MTTTRTTKTVCGCGKRMSKYSQMCKACHAARMATVYAEADDHVTRGICPRCGTELIRNTSMTGWWQCGAYADPSRRKPEHVSKPSCEFQCTTSEAA